MGKSSTLDTQVGALNNSDVRVILETLPCDMARELLLSMVSSVKKNASHVAMTGDLVTGLEGENYSRRRTQFRYQEFKRLEETGKVYYLWPGD